jgi:hypothetical protein
LGAGVFRREYLEHGRKAMRRKTQATGFAHAREFGLFREGLLQDRATSMTCRKLWT